MDRSGPGISAGLVTRKGNGDVYYDTHITVSTSYDNGVTAQGSHGRYASFNETRTKPLVSDTGDYTLSLVRGSVTSNCIPLFVPKPSQLITENGTQIWETSAQPGLAFTWTGPVYTNSGGSNAIVATKDWLFASWPTYGAIPFYTTNTLPATGAADGLGGFLDLSASGISTSCLATTAASRLTTLFTNAGMTVTVTSPTAAPGYGMSQVFSFQNTSTYQSVYLDFTLPPLNAQNNYGQNTGTHPSKSGILQACKLLGFIPGQVFVIPPATTVTTSRAYQLGFRATLNLYCYKNVRWVPEDANAPFPSVYDVANGNTSSYFDSYSYSHYVNNCINPAFQRCIYDPYDSTVVIGERCLTKQLQACCIANAGTNTFYNPTTSYVAGNSVIYGGRVYIAQVATSQIPPTGVTQSQVNWLDAGESFNYSYVSNQVYLTGDVVTFYSGTTLYYAVATGTTTGPPSTGAQNNWGAGISLQSAGVAVQTNLPTIGTLAPSVVFNSTTQLFSFNLDSYGFGGSLPSNVDDGYYGFIDDAQFPQTVAQQNSNATLNDFNRDSWGLTGCMSVTTPAYTNFRRPGGINTCYDERFSIEVDDYFHQLFGNWPCIRLNYLDPRTDLTTSYIRYILPAATAGLTTPFPLPLSNPTAVTTGYLPYGRIAGNQPYLYSIPQSYPSIGLAWNQFDTIVVVSGEVPVVDDQVCQLYKLGDTGLVTQFQTSAGTLKVLSEILVKPMSQTMAGQEYRNEIIYEPQTPVVMDLQKGQVFQKFDYQLFLRSKTSQLLRPLSISNAGCVNLRWVFSRK